MSKLVDYNMCSFYVLKSQQHPELQQQQWSGILQCWAIFRVRLCGQEFDYQNHAQNHAHYVTGHVIKSSSLPPVYVERSLGTRLC